MMMKLERWVEEGANRTIEIHLGAHFFIEAYDDGKKLFRVFGASLEELEEFAERELRL